MARKVLFVYLSEQNKKFVEKLSKDKAIPMSQIISELIEKKRTGKSPLAVTTKRAVPGYVKQTTKWLESMSK